MLIARATVILTKMEMVLTPLFMEMVWIVMTKIFSCSLCSEIWYDGIDQNCDGGNDYDQDGDGEMSIDYFGVDCDDLDADVGTFAEEIFYDGYDQNCDGLSDYDFDGDGEESDMIGGTDCNDILASINTQAVEIWYNGMDDNCDGLSISIKTVMVKIPQAMAVMTAMTQIQTSIWVPQILGMTVSIQTVMVGLTTIWTEMGMML